MAGMHIGRSAAYQLLCNVRLRGEACIGYLGHPFAKLTIWSFTTLLFFFVMWYSTIEAEGDFSHA
jgi:hypothetical protein